MAKSWELFYNSFSINYRYRIVWKILEIFISNVFVSSQSEFEIEIVTFKVSNDFIFNVLKLLIIIFYFNLKIIEFIACDYHYDMQWNTVSTVVYILARMHQDIGDSPIRGSIRFLHPSEWRCTHGSILYLYDIFSSRERFEKWKQMYLPKFFFFFFFTIIAWKLSYFAYNR